MVLRFGISYFVNLNLIILMSGELPVFWQEWLIFNKLPRQLTQSSDMKTQSDQIKKTLRYRYYTFCVSMAWYRKKNYLELFQLLDLIFYIREIYEDIPERNSSRSLKMPDKNSSAVQIQYKSVEMASVLKFTHPRRLTAVTASVIAFTLL